MTIDELRAALRAIADRQNARDYTEEEDHREADHLLLLYIGDEEVTRIFHGLRKWYT